MKKFDFLLLILMILLFSVSLIMLYGLSLKSDLYYFKRQLIWALLGFLIFFAFSFIDYRIFRDESQVVFWLYILVILGLAGLFIFSEPIRGSLSWFRLGKFSFEPIEPMKVMLLILLAKYFSLRHIELYRLRHLIASGFYSLVPASLAIFQSDFGSALILGFIWLFLILSSGVKIRHFLILLLCGILVSSLLFLYFLKPYQKERIIGFIWPEYDPQGSGYNLIQSVIAVGSGMTWGRGLGYGVQSQLNFLPEAETDFIFAALAEEWGFIGAGLVFVLFLFLISRICWIGYRSQDNFARLFSLGAGFLIFIQFAIHTGMNMGIFPITGLTLPFISYGGTSLLSFSLMLGIINSIRRNT